MPLPVCTVHNGSGRHCHRVPFAVLVPILCVQHEGWAPLLEMVEGLLVFLTFINVKDICVRAYSIKSKNKQFSI